MGQRVPVLKTLFEQRFLNSHFQIAITRKEFKAAPSNFLGLKSDTITCRVWLSIELFLSTLCCSIFEGLWKAQC